jgi:hypothetical protein
MREYTICEAADLASEIVDRISEEIVHDFDLLNHLDTSDTDFTKESDREADVWFDRVLNTLSLAKHVFETLF